MRRPGTGARGRSTRGRRARRRCTRGQGHTRPGGTPGRGTRGPKPAVARRPRAWQGSPHRGRLPRGPRRFRQQPAARCPGRPEKRRARQGDDTGGKQPEAEHRQADGRRAVRAVLTEAGHAKGVAEQRVGDGDRSHRRRQRADRERGLLEREADHRCRGERVGRPGRGRAADACVSQARGHQLGERGAQREHDSRCDRQQRRPIRRARPRGEDQAGGHRRREQAEGQEPRLLRTSGGGRPPGREDEREPGAGRNARGPVRPARPPPAAQRRQREAEQQRRDQQRLHDRNGSDMKCAGLHREAQRVRRPPDDPQRAAQQPCGKPEAVAHLPPAQPGQPGEPGPASRLERHASGSGWAIWRSLPEHPRCRTLLGRRRQGEQQCGQHGHRHYDHARTRAFDPMPIRCLPVSIP